MQLWLAIEFSGNHLKKRLHIKAGITPAFTMVELIFVIVVLGILAAVAIPRLAASRDDAVLVKGKSQVSAIRSGIAMQRSRRLLEGNTPFVPPILDGNTTSTIAQVTTLFVSAVDNNGNNYNILEYGLQPSTNDGFWTKASANTVNPILYDFHLEGATARFEYNPTTGAFTCTAGTDCNALTQ